MPNTPVARPSARPVPRPSGLARIIDYATRLATLIEAEVVLLKARRPRDLVESAPQKEELARAYQEELGSLRAHPDVVRTAPGADLAALRAAGERLNAALDAQRRRVTAARDVSERMLRAITEEVDRRKTPYRSYNAAATYNRPGPKKPTVAPTALAFHEVV